MSADAEVKTDELKRIIKKIGQKFDVNQWSDVKLSAALHRYLVEDTGINRKPLPVNRFELDRDGFKKVLTEGGNCVEKSFFLSALYQQMDDVESRLVVINRIPVGHVLVEICFNDWDADSVIDELRDFYISQSVRPGNQFVYAQSSCKSWFIADPGLSLYIGDTSHIVNHGLASNTDGDWSWSYPIQYKNVGIS